MLQQTIIAGDWENFAGGSCKGSSMGRLGRVFNTDSQIYLFFHSISSQGRLHPTGFPLEFNGFVGAQLSRIAAPSWAERKLVIS